MYMKNLALTTAALAFLGLAGCNGGHPPTGRESYKLYGEKVEDTRIVNKIRNAFRASPTIPDELIHLAVDRGVVQLSGFVRSYREADLAVLTAESIPDVKKVINSLVVLSSTDYTEKRAAVESKVPRR